MRCPGDAQVVTSRGAAQVWPREPELSWARTQLGVWGSRDEP